MLSERYGLYRKVSNANILKNSVLIHDVFLFYIQTYSILIIYRKETQKRFIVLRPNTDLRYDTTQGKYKKM